MDKWKTTAKQMYKNKQGYKKIAARVGKTENEVKDFLKSEKSNQSAAKNKPEKFMVFENLAPAIHIQEWSGNRVLSFGLISDTHINSKYTQLTYLQKFYEICSRRGVKDIYHVGDIDEGEQMRTGHQYECYTQGADDHISEIVANCPCFNGIATHFITGNHDSSIYKRCGVDIGEIIAMKRKDMKYLGRDCARIEITPNCILELRHPWDGTAYALSYKPQKMIDGMEADSKPNILAIGHYHKLEYLFYRNVHCFQAGCFQTQTPFTRGKGISVHLGGWIITVEVDKRGYIQRIVPEMIPFYKGINSDYKNWNQSSND
ncbi:MAG: metallophosphoesterase family protein [Methanoregula sp.]|nr:metallophosphoesterase family protein [Methanoregula sp.]